MVVVEDDIIELKEGRKEREKSLVNEHSTGLDKGQEACFNC